MSILKQALQDYKISMESIPWQSKDFFKSLSSLFDNVKKARLENNLGSINKLSLDIAKLIKKRFNITVIVDLYSTYPCINYNYINKGHPWSKYEAVPYTKSDANLTSIVKKHKYSIGTVDKDKLWVDGYLAEHTFYLCIGIDAAVPELTSDEIAAQALHELGHAFTYLCAVGGTMLHTAILQSTYELLIHGNTKNGKHNILITSSDEFGLSKTARDKILSNLEKEPDVQKTMLVLMSEIIKKDRLESGFLYANVVSPESQADEFAMRFNVGTSLATGLDKLYIACGQEDFVKSRTTSLVISIWESLSWLTVFVFGGFILFFINLIKANINKTYKFDRYDTDKIRFDKMKRSLIEEIKVVKDKKAKEILIHQAEEIDKIAKEYHRHENLYQLLGKWLTPGSMKYEKEREMIANLVQLANNDLFLIDIG